jgi:Uma2 family endonuclease
VKPPPQYKSSFFWKNQKYGLFLLKIIKFMQLVTTYLTTTETAIEVQPTLESLETQYEQERGKPMPSKNHSIIQGNAYFELRNQYGDQYDIFPELSLSLTTDGKGAVPDICIYDKTPRDWEEDVIKTNIPPLLAIEIPSPRQVFDDITDKIRNIYFPAGMKSVWVVLPNVQAVMLFRPNQKTETYNQGVLNDTASGFELNIDKIFM